MQALSNTNELNTIFNNKKVLLDEKLNQKQDKLYCSALLLNEWIELKDLMWTKNCIISPGKFVKNIQTIAEKKDRGYIYWMGTK